MLSILRGTISFILEPAFIEVKAIIVAYLLAFGSLWAAVASVLGILFVLAVMNGIAYFEGTKSLWSIYWLIQNSTPDSIRVADVIPSDVLAAKYGYAHSALRFGPHAQGAGSMKVLYDSSGQVLDYQCGFNMFGTSYLLTASDRKLNDMPLFQRYLTLHELGHGSMMGGVIWIRSKWLIMSAALSCVFGLAVASPTKLGIAAITSTILTAFVFSRKVVVESEAERYADSYALAHIAREDPASAVSVIRWLLKRIADIDAVSSRYDQLINKARSSMLREYLRLLERRPTFGELGIYHSVKWPYYFSAGLLFFWILLSADTQSISARALALAFGALFILAICFRNYTVKRMLILDSLIGKMLGDNSDAPRS